MHLCSTLIQRIALSWIHTTVTTPRSKYRLQKVIVRNHVQKCENYIIWSPFTETAVWEHIHASLWELSLRWTRGLAAVLLNDTDRLRSLLCVCASLSKCLFIYSRLHADVFVAIRHWQNCLMAFVRSHPPNTHTHRKISHSLNNCAFHTNSVITLLSARQRETQNILQSTRKTLGKK